MNPACIRSMAKTFMLCLIRTSLRLCGIAHIKKRDVTSIKGRVYPGVMNEPFEEPFFSVLIYDYINKV